MSSKASTTAIGGFVIGAAVLFTASLVYFGGATFGAESISCVMYFDGSLKGLKVGAPVLFKGVRVGEVTRIVVRYQPDDLKMSIPVFADLYSDNIERVDSSERHPETEVPRLVEKGLRAKLEMQSVVTGMLIISLDFHEDKPARLQDAGHQEIEIPTLPSMMEELTKTLEKLPFEDLFNDIRNTINGIDELVRSEKLASAIESLDKTLKDFGKLAEDVDQEVKPLADNLNATLQEAHDTIALVQEKIPTVTDRLNPMLEEFTLVGKNVNDRIDPLVKRINNVSDTLKVALNQATSTLEKAEGLVDEDGEVYFEIVSTIRELKAAIRSIRMLSDYLEQHPEALLQGKKAPGG